MSLATLKSLGLRFQGVDLKFRHQEVNWPRPWKAECFSAKHEGARFAAYGDTPEEAVEMLIEKVKAGMGDEA